MPNDLKKLEEAVLALAPRQRAELLRKLIEAPGSLPASSTEQEQVAESQAPYSLYLQPFEGAESMHSTLSTSDDLARERGSVMKQLDRITQQPGMMGGKACIRGMRVTASMIVGQIGAGASVEDVLADYPYLEREDILQALRYAAWRASEREIILPSA